MKHIMAIVMMHVALSGCATMRDSLILGAGSGAAAGASIGVITTSSERLQGALIGGAIGAAIGLGTAYFVKNGLDARDSEVRKNTLFSLEKFGVSEVPRQGSSVPAISFPVVSEEKISTHRQGNKVIEGHHVWILGDDSNIEYSEPESKDKIGKKKK